jgi:hypothetical protein
MSTAILISFVLPVFFARDWLLLRMGPGATTIPRLRQYGVVQLMSMVLFSTVMFSVRTERLLEIAFAPAVTLAVVLFYGVLLAVCIWIRRTDRHRLAWLIALLPNPALIGAIVALARLLLPRDSSLAMVLALLLTSLWIALIDLSVWKARSAPLDAPDLDFSLIVAGLANSTILVLLPLGAWIEGSLAWR